MRVNSSERDRILQLAREKGERCPSCGSDELLWMALDDLRPAGDGFTMTLICQADPHPYPNTDPYWYFTVSAAKLRGIGVSPKP